MPGVYAGRYVSVRLFKPGIRCFNPCPAFTPGATGNTRIGRRSPAMFQSMPGVYAGRYPKCLLFVVIPRSPTR